MGAAGLYGLGYLRGQDHTSRYHLFFLLAMSGNLGLVLAADAMGFYLFFALMSLSSYGLVVHAGGDAVYRAGRIYLIMAVIGELLLFAGLVGLTLIGVVLFMAIEVAERFAIPWHTSARNTAAGESL